jgi:hypothetical protein
MQMGRMAATVVGLFMISAPSIHAANVAIDCSKKASINTALGKLDRSVANVVTVAGACTEDVQVSAHRDLTIVGSAGAGIVATTADSLPMYIEANSRVTLRDISISGVAETVSCNDRSTCVLDSVVVSGGRFGGVSVQKQSSADLIGNTLISNIAGTGLGVFGASSANVGRNVSITGVRVGNGSGYAISLLDGSFIRVDGGTLSNNENGVSADRGSVVKLLGTTVTNNTFTRGDGQEIGTGVSARASTVQLSGGTYSGNNFGVIVNDLSYVTLQGNISIAGNTQQQIVCTSPTSITQPKNLGGIGGLCPYVPPAP